MRQPLHGIARTFDKFNHECTKLLQTAIVVNKKAHIMKKNKGWITLVGFLLAGTGFLAIA